MKHCGAVHVTYNNEGDIVYTNMCGNLIKEYETMCSACVLYNFSMRLARRSHI